MKRKNDDSLLIRRSKRVRKDSWLQTLHGITDKEDLSRSVSDLLAERLSVSDFLKLETYAKRCVEVCVALETLELEKNTKINLLSQILEEVQEESESGSSLEEQESSNEEDHSEEPLIPSCVFACGSYPYLESLDLPDVGRLSTKEMIKYIREQDKKKLPQLQMGYFKAIARSQQMLVFFYRFQQTQPCSSTGKSLPVPQPLDVKLPLPGEHVKGVSSSYLYLNDQKYDVQTTGKQLMFSMSINKQPKHSDIKEATSLSKIEGLDACSNAVVHCTIQTLSPIYGGTLIDKSAHILSQWILIHHNEEYYTNFT